MNNNIKTLAEFKGFCMWADEAHNPGDVIDWAGRYDDEFINYSHALIRSVLELQASGTDPLTHFGAAVPEHDTVTINFKDGEMLDAMSAAHAMDVSFNKFVELSLMAQINRTNAETLRSETTE
jgi:hypothetical protein